MKKSVLLVLSLFFSLSMLSYSKNEFGIVYDEDFVKIGAAYLYYVSQLKNHFKADYILKYFHVPFTFLG